MSALRKCLLALLEALPLTADETEAAVGEVMDGQSDPIEIAAFLTAIHLRGESAEQLVGAARAMRARSQKIVSQQRGLLDTCGTGGDSLHTFNISTATAFVAAAAGVPVAKHGNRSASSRSGSADVLEALGVRIDLTPEQVGQCIDEVGLGFCFAQKLHTAMKHAAPVRQKLGFRTLFNLLGPLTNPAGAEYQLIGAGRVALARLMGTALADLGVRQALVVCGNDELDEVCLWGPTTVFAVRHHMVEELEWRPEQFGLKHCSVEALRVGGPIESAAIIRDVLDGTPGAPLEMVLANAAAALLAAERVASPAEGVEMARHAVLSGAAARLLERFVRLTQALADQRTQ